MVLDTSAILAVLQMEPEAETFARLIEAAPVRLVSAVSVVEAGILMEARKGEAGAEALDAFLREADIQIASFDAEQASLARLAWRRFGRGRHSAGLNFGDCAAYALAQGAGEPLLFKGTDFALTDVVRVE